MNLRREVEGAAGEAGLPCRGGFRLSDSERVGPLAGARSLLLFGFAGGADWAAFAGSAEASDGASHPLDRWSERVVGALAARFGATALFPFEGPPYQPFQLWARRAAPVFPSPLGLLIHPDFGLALSYRGALAFAEAMDFPTLAARAHPCEACATKPCLSTCPVGAFTGTSYQVEACAGFVRGSQGASCREAGCLARRACPVGRADAQTAAQGRFHLAAFLAARGGE